MKTILVGSVSVLLLAGVTSAAQLDLVWAGGGKEITLTPSETAVINVVLTLEDAESVQGAAWFVLADEDGVVTPTGEPLDFEVIDYSEEVEGWVYDRSPNSPLPIANINEATGFFQVWIGLSDVVQDPSAGSMLLRGPGSWTLSNYVIHCVKEPSEDVIYFNEYPLYAPVLTDEFFIDFEPILGPPLLLHQVPEPASIGLLALGGLAALRRRR